MIRFAIAFLIAFTSNAFAAASFWEWDWETYPSSNTNNPPGIQYQGNCFEKALGDPYNSIELSTKYVRTGTKSARLFTNGYYSNQEGSRNCNWKDEYLETTVNGVKVKFPKQRLEPRYGYDGTTGANGFQSWGPTHERWFRYSFYLPSDEGTFSYWNTGPYSSKGLLITQIMAANPYTGGVSTSHEVGFVLRGGPSLSVETYYTNPDTTGGRDVDYEYGPIDLGTFPLKKDAWNDIVYVHRPGYQNSTQNPTGYGKLKVWLNCEDWANCTPIVNRDGMHGIVTMADRYFKGGLYEHKRPEYNRIIAMYMDNIKIGIKGAETDAQMLALMTDTFGTGGEIEDPEIPTASNLIVNSGNAITSSQDPIGIAVNNMNNITNCTMKGSTDSIPLAVKWDPATNTGVFPGVDTTGFSSAGSVTCYDEPYINNPVMSSINMTEVNVVDSSQTSLSNWQYTSGRRIVKANAGAGDAYTVYGSAYNTVVGDRARFDITYYCTGNSCQNMYFDIMHNVTTTGDKRIRLQGTAGALVAGQAASVALHGSNYTVRNYTLPDGVYRVSLLFTVTESNNYRFRAGWTSASAANLTMELHEVIMLKNWTTKVLTSNVTYSVPDTTAPTLSNCSIGNTRNEFGSYTATLLCDADEIGGTDYAVVAATDIDPDEAFMKAPTGTLGSGQAAAATTEIEFNTTGMDYQDLFGWVMRCDTQDNCSDIVPLTFTDELELTEVKKIKFDGTTKLFKSGGSAFNGVIDEFTLYDTDPLRAPSAGRDNALVEFQSIGVGTGADPDLPAGTFELTAEDAVFGDLNALTLGTYYYTAYTFTGGVLKFSSGTIDLIAE